MDLEMFSLNNRNKGLIDSKTAAKVVSFDCERWDEMIAGSQLFGVWIIFIKFHSWMKMNDDEEVINQKFFNVWVELASLSRVSQWQSHFNFWFYVPVNWKFWKVFSRLFWMKARRWTSGVNFKSNCSTSTDYLAAHQQIHVKNGFSYIRWQWLRKSPWHRHQHKHQWNWV